MPPLEDVQPPSEPQPVIERTPTNLPQRSESNSHPGALLRRESSEQYSIFARAAMLSSSNATVPPQSPDQKSQKRGEGKVSEDGNPSATMASTVRPQRSSLSRALSTGADNAGRLGFAMSDTPAITPFTSTPGSPHIPAKQKPNSMAVVASGTSTPRSPRLRATTLDIPGLTKSKVSPTGQIAERDVGSKLIIIMVGLPARGKSYIVKKIARFLNWLQHPTRIFNVGDRRRVAAGSNLSVSSIEGKLRESLRSMQLNNIRQDPQGCSSPPDQENLLGPPAIRIGEAAAEEHSLPAHVNGTSAADDARSDQGNHPAMEQSSSFFDPDNSEAKRIREQVAHETLDELLKYVLEGHGSVGILDATNHTIERRMSLVKHIRDRDPDINIMFIESRCQDQNLLESNMRLKLSGPDYRDKDPLAALKDFQERVRQYEKKYQMLGDFEENNNLSYCSMIDVGRKMITHKINGFLSIQAVTYLMNFNLAPRQIWLTRHGESIDNINGKIGGDSHLSPQGIRYGKALERFMTQQRLAWDQLQIERKANTHFPPLPGDTTPPNPEHTEQLGEVRNFCVWTSMLNRSVETASHFSEDIWDIKQMRMLDEMHSGSMEGMTYQEIRDKFPADYDLRKRDKLRYRYPGPGGEGYLDVISRLRKVIIEVERMTDHVLIIGHRAVTRVLLAYFLGLKQEDISDLDVPLGVAYMLEPRPYGVEFRAYRWNPQTDEFVWLEDYRPRKASPEIA